MRANNEKRVGADGPTELAFVQVIVLTERVWGIGQRNK
jgi:hypothetical protein